MLRKTFAEKAPKPVLRCAMVLFDSRPPTTHRSIQIRKLYTLQNYINLYETFSNTITVVIKIYFSTIIRHSIINIRSLINNIVVSSRQEYLNMLVSISLCVL